MKLYNIFVKNNQENNIEDIKPVKDGFSYYAFLFTIFWFLHKKMFKETLYIILIYSLAIMLISSFFESSRLAFEISFALLIGINANYLLEKSLQKKGYKFAGAQFGSDEQEAQLGFLKNSKKSF